MSDLSRFLPFSNRPKGDESGVTSDRRMPLAAVVEEAARLLDTAPDRAARAADFARAARVTDAATSVASPADLRAVAATIAAGRRQSTKALARAVRALLLLSDHLGVEPRIDGTTLGIVSLYGATSAPLERRAVVGGQPCAPPTPTGSSAAGRSSRAQRSTSRASCSACRTFRRNVRQGRRLIPRRELPRRETPLAL